jgi:hypothetical protein
MTFSRLRPAPDVHGGGASDGSTWTAGQHGKTRKIEAKIGAIPRAAAISTERPLLSCQAACPATSSGQSWQCQFRGWRLCRADRPTLESFYDPDRWICRGS